MNSQTPPHPKTPPPEDRFLANCLLYLDGQLSTEGFASLQQTMRREPKRLEQFVDLAMQREMVSDVLDADHADELIEQVLGAYGAVSTPDELPPIHIDSSSPLTRQAYVSALSYVLRHTFTPKCVAVLATAAAVLLGMVLAIVTLSGADERKPIAAAPGADTPNEQVPAAPRLVATLTAEHDAKWDRRPGLDLYAGQQFILTEGLAEITTNDGAVAILEAPCTIELIDSDNALRLHAGKLVGRCDTEHSRGFTVYTSSARIVDIGTEFGVDVRDDGTSLTQVFEGEVRLMPAKTQGGLVTLIKDEAAVVNPQGHIQTVKPNALAFVRVREFEARIKADDSPYDRWLVWSMQMRRDPALRLYFAIDAEDQTAGALRNATVSGPAGLVGAMGDAKQGWLAPRWSEGRWAEKPALRFDRRRQTAVVVPPGPVLHLGDTYTIATWVRFDAPGRNHILTHRRELPDQPGFEDAINLIGILGPSGNAGHTDDSIFYHTGSTILGRDDWSRFCSPPVLGQVEGWVLIAVVAEGDRVMTFLNGQLVDTRRQAMGGARGDFSSQSMLLGASIVFHHEGLDGWLGEVMVLDRAMSAEDVAEMYEAGKPAP